MVSQEQKKIYNQRAREKEREKKNTQSKSESEEEEKKANIPEVKFETPLETKFDKPEELVESGDETFVLDKKTYMYLIEQAQKAITTEENRKDQPTEKPKAIEEPPEKKDKVAVPENDFFFQVKRQCFSTIASMVPILAIQAVILGAKFFKTSTNKLTYSNTSNPQNVVHEPPQFTSEAQAVNWG